VNLTKRKYNIAKIIIMMIDKIGVTKYTCKIAINVARRTIIADGVNALSKDNPSTTGIDSILASYPISLLIVENAIKANINFITGVIYISFL